MATAQGSAMIMKAHLRISWVLPLISSALACGGETSNVLYDDCRDEDQACVSPLKCVPPFDDSSEKHKCSLKADLPSCQGSPAGQAVPFSVTKYNRPTHWVWKQGCVPVTYSSELSSHASLINAASHLWNQLSCGLCFTDSKLSTKDIDITAKRWDLRIHFKAVPRHELVNDVGSGDIYFEEMTGRMCGAEGRLNREALTKYGLAEFLKFIGIAAGLDETHVSPPTDSLFVTSDFPDPKKQLGSADREAFCKLYGPPAYCDE
jgi:hypothetical protein